MNLAEIDRVTRERLLKREEHVGFVVFRGTYCWIVAWEAFFNLDQQKNFDAAKKKYADNPRLLREYRTAEREFRSGIATLTADAFPAFRDGDSAKIVTTGALRDEFFAEDESQYAALSGAMETELSFGTPMSENLVQLRSRLFSKLPKFYINYDRKVFMHMVRGRSYDKVVLDGWWGAECDFEHMIPIAQRYWSRDKHEDFWSVTNFRNE